MQLFVTICNDWKLLIIVTKGFVLDVYGHLDLRPVIALLWFVSQKDSQWLVNRFSIFGSVSDL